MDFGLAKHESHDEDLTARGRPRHDSVHVA